MALSFLSDDWGFSGPELTADGVAYHRVGLHVEMGYWAWKNEHGFTTTLAASTGPNGAPNLASHMRPVALARPMRPPRRWHAVCHSQAHRPARNGAARSHCAP